MHRPTNVYVMSMLIGFHTVILSMAHYFIYFSLTRFIDMSGRENYWLALILGLLSSSFFISTVCASYWDNRKTRYAYYLSAIWLGALQYLFISFLLVWGIAFITEWIGIYAPLGFLGAIGIIISIGVVVYGLVNAWIISLTRIDISIRNLPDYWEGKKIAHISDVHIGHILRARFVKRIVKNINNESLEMVCITGDLFDGMDGKLEHLVDHFREVRSPQGVYYVDGNHETYLGVDRTLKHLRNTKIRILRDEIVTVEGLDIIGIDYPEPGKEKDIAKTLESIDTFQKEKPSILLYHKPSQIEEIAKTGVDLELSGHTHHGQMWPIGLFTYLLFKGRDYGMTHIGDYTLYTSSGIGTWGPPMRVGSKSEMVIITLYKKI